MNLNRLKTLYIRSWYKLAFTFFRPALFTRAFSYRWPYQQTMEQMIALKDLLLSVKVPGDVCEIGAAEGHSTIWMYKAMSEAGIVRSINVVDTFAGFTPEDKAAEYKRGKTDGLYDGLFSVNCKKWFDASMKCAGVKAQTFQSDASVFDYAKLPRLAFVFLDVDLYRPVKEALKRILPRMEQGGIVVIDDCQEHKLWDGALQAYHEHCKAAGINPEIIAGKFGIIRC